MKWFIMFCHSGQSTQEFHTSYKHRKQASQYFFTPYKNNYYLKDTEDRPYTSQTQWPELTVIATIIHGVIHAAGGSLKQSRGAIERAVWVFQTYMCIYLSIYIRTCYNSLTTDLLLCHTCFLCCMLTSEDWFCRNYANLLQRISHIWEQ